MSGQLWSTYGMTETLSHIALRAINGSLRSTAYTPFDGVRVSLSKDHTLVIDAPKISPKTLITNDIAEIGTDGTFTIIGRRDNIICSGGVKIQIEEVESLLAVHLSPSFAITQVPDEKFGQAVVLLVKTGANDSSTIKEAINDLPKFWKPKHIYTVDDIPMTKTGKKARADIRGIALKKYQLTS